MDDRSTAGPAVAAPMPWCRVLVVEQGEGLWGAQRYLLRLAPLLAARGVLQVLAAPASSAVARAWLGAGLVHVDLPLPAGPDRSVRTEEGQLAPGKALREVYRSLWIAGRITQLARRSDVDAIHANSHWSHLDCIVAARLARRSVVLHLHEENQRDALGRLRGLAVLAADASIAVSGAVAASLGPRAARRATVIRNGIDADLMTPGPASTSVRALLAGGSDAPVVLALSRLDPRKGLDHVIRAVAGLPPELASTRLAIAGAPSLDRRHVNHLRALAGDLLGERVTFLGAREDVADLLRAADVLVLASSLEGLPLSILEAQACGTPVVAYPAAGVPEVVVHGETGLLAEAGNVPDLTRQLARALGDPPLRRRLGRNGRERVLAESTLADQADRQVEVLRSLVNRRRRGSSDDQRCHTLT